MSQLEEIWNIGKGKIVNSPNYINTLFAKLFSLLQQQDLTDVCIIASNGARWNAHKIVLAAGSAFFSAMFKYECDDKESKPNEVKIEKFNGEIVKQILIFLYTGTINLVAKNVTDILEAADFFEIKPLLSECEQFMKEELEPTNCLGVALFAEQHSLDVLCEEAFKFACMHFEQVSNEPEFLELNVDCVVRLIGSDDLCVQTEEMVFLSILKWIEHNKDTRAGHAYKLFSLIHYWSLNLSFIKENRSKLPKDTDVIELISTWFEWHCSPDTMQPKTRNQANSKLVMIYKQEMHCYNPNSNNWISKSLPESPSSFEKVFEVNNNNKLIFVCGARFVKYDIETTESVELTELSRPRTSFGLGLLQNELYVVGGYSAAISKWTVHVDKFNFNSNTWEAVRSLPKPIAEPKVAVNGKYLHVKGKSDDEFLASFNIHTNVWTLNHVPFCAKFSKFGIADIDGNIYFVGENTSKPGVCHVYQYSGGSWDCHDMKIALSGPKCFTWNKTLIVCGTLEDTSLVLRFDPKSLQWKSLDAPGSFKDEHFDVLNVSQKCMN